MIHSLTSLAASTPQRTTPQAAAATTPAAAAAAAACLAAAAACLGAVCCGVWWAWLGKGVTDKSWSARHHYALAASLTPPTQPHQKLLTPFQTSHSHYCKLRKHGHANRQMEMGAERGALAEQGTKKQVGGTTTPTSVSNEAPPPPPLVGERCFHLTHPRREGHVVE